MPRKPKAFLTGPDPLVPINGAHVRASLEDVGLTNREAARRLSGILGKTIAPGTVDDLVRGRTSRCRQSLRDALAQVLGPPDSPEYLSAQTHLVAEPLGDPRGKAPPF